jgi:hypothetical protein
MNSIRSPSFNHFQSPARLQVQRGARSYNLGRVVLGDPGMHLMHQLTSATVQKLYSRNAVDRPLVEETQGTREIVLLTVCKATI